MKIAIISNSVVPSDAIGNDIEKMLLVLGEKHDCYVYSPYVLNHRIRFSTKREFLGLISDEAGLLIYHHSIFWDDVENILDKARCKIVFKYHNVTPPEYFRDYSRHYYDLCRLGREQTARLSERYSDALWISDSTFNSKDIVARRKAVLPPFNDIEALSSAGTDDYILNGLIESNKINLLFVGRIAPNKKHAFLFDILSDYIKNYGKEVCLHIIGKRDERLKSYFDELKYLIKKYGLKDHVRFVGEVSRMQLLSYYLGCDFYVCPSEHEGFCVPIIEAQYFRLPVIAKNAGAVPETAGEGQLLLSDDPREYSAAIHIINTNQSYKHDLIKNGSANYSARFGGELLKKKFLYMLSEYTGENM